MSISITCRCGKVISLEKDSAGPVARCPHCGTDVTAEGQPAMSDADAVFNRDKFLLRRKRRPLSEDYIYDENQQPLLFVDHPRNRVRAGLAFLAGALVIAGFAVVGFMKYQDSLPDTLVLDAREFAAIARGIMFFLVMGTAGIIAGWLTIVALQPRRRITIYRDESMNEPLLHIRQNGFFQPIIRTFAVTDAEGRPLARFRKNLIYSICRIRWRCTDPQKNLLCTIKEDSLGNALLKRLLRALILISVIPTNFIMYKGKGSSRKIIGELSRRFTIEDRHVLDMTADDQRSLDRRIALALGVLLDTTERR